jgi:hypothetical protein
VPDSEAQRIEVLFALTDRTVAIDVADDADPTQVVDTLTSALEADDPVEAERQLNESFHSGGGVSRG